MWLKSIAIRFIFSIACSPTPTVPQSCATQSMSRILISSAGVSGRLCGYTLISMVMTAALTIIIPSSRGQHQIRLCEPVVSMSSFALCFVSNKAFFICALLHFHRQVAALLHTQKTFCNWFVETILRHIFADTVLVTVGTVSSWDSLVAQLLTALCFFTLDALMKTEYDFHRLMAAYEMTHNPNETNVKEIRQFV